MVRQDQLDIAPAQKVLAIRRTENSLEAKQLLRGLLLFSAKDIKIGTSTISSCEETNATKTALQAALNGRPCVMTATSRSIELVDRALC